MKKSKLYSIKDETSELYFQIEVNKYFWKFLSNLFTRLYDRDTMILNFIEKKYQENKHYSYNQDGVYAIIIFANKRAHITIIGLPNNNEYKNFIKENYEFIKIKSNI